jgi:hypothetical protein
MACTKEDLKKLVEAAPRSVDGKVRFSKELQRDLLEYSTQQQAEGRSQQSIADEVGVNCWTLSRWHQREKKGAGEARFVEVRAGRKLAATGTAAPFEVTCPSGHEVRVPAGFEVRALRELLTALEGR